MNNSDFVKDFKEQILKSSPIRIIDKKVQASLKPGQEPPKGSYVDYPPMNTDINFASLIPAARLSAGAVQVAQKELPENFTLRDIPGITPVGNQRLCGSCWAWATSQAVNDVFVVQDYNNKKLNGESNPVGDNPGISAMYMLSCYPGCRDLKNCNDTGKFPDSRICGGGNPGTLCNWISQYGVSWNPCVNYDACDNDPVCNGDAQKHFQGDSTVYLNNAFPTCGCYISNSNHQIYKIIGPKLNSITVPIPYGVNNVDSYFRNISKNGYRVDNNIYQSVVLAIKQHIQNYGSGIGGFFVLKNLFLPKNSSFYGCLNGSRTCGSLCKNPDGIYLDMVDYTTLTRLSNPPAFAGGHAITVTGWGIGKVHKSLIDPVLNPNNQDCIDVPYWECRNSWGQEWNRDGYFRIAMWPYNKISVLEINILGLGGIITFKAAPNPINPIIPIRQNNRKGFDPKKTDFFEGRNKPNPTPYNPPKPSPKPSPPAPLTKECSDAKKRQDDINTTITDIKNKITQSNTKLNNLNKQITQVKNQIDSLNEDLTKANSNLDNTTSDISKLCGIKVSSSLMTIQTPSEENKYNIFDKVLILVLLISIIVVCFQIYKNLK